MTDLYFGGAEVPSWRKVLSEQNVTHVTLSYMGLRRRVKFARPWIIDEKFPAEQKIFLDSGAYTVNQDTEGEKYSQGDLKQIASEYMAFVQQNIERVEFVSEFDSLALGLPWIKAMREDFYDDLPEGKFLPVWHAEWGLTELEDLCRKYTRVGVMQTALGGRNLVPTLNNLVRQYGVKLHGIAMTKPDTMSDIRWSSVASTSWISPAQFGDTIVWTGRELKRYPKKMKTEARKRHRTYLISEGFDAEKIANDDSDEVIRLSIWSWQRLIANLNQSTGTREVVATSGDTPEWPDAEVGPSLVDTTPSEVRNSVATAVRPRESTELLPVMGVQTLTETTTGPDGKPVEHSQSLVTIRSSSQRMCDTCFLAGKCPRYEPKANCAYEIPVVVKTKDQLQALQNGLLEMQTQRVLFARMSEEIEGGYPDPNVSSELDRLQKMIKIKTELEQDSFSVKFEAKGRNGGDGAGIMTRLFGGEAGAQARALPAPIQADVVMASSLDIVDAEIIDVPGKGVATYA